MKKKANEQALLELDQWLDDYYSCQFIQRNKPVLDEEEFDPLEELLDEYDKDQDRV